MIRLVLLVLLVIAAERVFNGGLEINIDGKKHSIEVKNGNK